MSHKIFEYEVTLSSLNLMSEPHERDRTNSLPVIPPHRWEVPIRGSILNFRPMSDHHCTDVLFWGVAIVSDLKLELLKLDRPNVLNDRREPIAITLNTDGHGFRHLKCRVL